MALVISAVGFFLLLGGVAVLAACLSPGYRARHPGRARVAVGAAVIGFVVLVAAGRLMMLPGERTGDHAPAADSAAAAAPPKSAALPRAGTSPVERHPWMVLPLAFALGLIMITAMMEWTAAFLVRRPNRAKAPVDANELKNRLLALNESGAKYRLVPAKECDLKLEYEVVDSSWHNLFSKIKLSANYGARLLFDPARHEVRWCEWLCTREFFIGVHGLGIVINWSWQLQVGYIDVLSVQVKREISAVVMQGGWTFRPVIFWFQAGRSRLRTVLDAWSLRVLPNWPETRARGLLAGVTYVLFIGYLLWMIGGFGEESLWTVHNLGVLAVISALWWAGWGLLTWLLAYLAKSKGEHG